MEPAHASLDLSPGLGTSPGVRLLSYLALLPASSVELDAVVDRAVAENPMLERTPWHRCRTCGLAAPAGDHCPACRSAHWAAEPEAVVDWRAELLRDAALELPAAAHPLLAAVVAGLDDHGLLPESADLTDPDRTGADVDDAAVRDVLRAVRLVGPPGIGAASPLACVRLQAHQLVEAGEAPELVAVVADEWLAAVAEERFDEVAAATGASPGEVVAAVRVLRARTRPFVSLPGGAQRSAPTDVVFTQETPEADVVAHVAGADAAGVGLVPDALTDLPAAGSPAVRAWVAPHLEAARRLLDAVAARSHMLQRVADELAHRQRAFLVEGPAGHAPLRRTDVAAALGVHASTVGRAVTGKVARCPDGRTVALAELFGTTPSLRAAVDAALRQHPGAPDREIADLLTAAGHRVARRTVAKYRGLSRPTEVANPRSPADRAAD